MTEEEIRSFIRIKLWQKEITQANLSKKSQVSQKVISEFLRGKRSILISTLKKIADACQLELNITEKQEERI